LELIEFETRLSGLGNRRGSTRDRPGTHLRSLINEVLDFSKIEADKLEINPEPVNLARLIDEVIGTAGQLAEKNQNRLVVEAQENLGALNADSGRRSHTLTSDARGSFRPSVAKGGVP
jgi:signal transduction histidine kinase